MRRESLRVGAIYVVAGQGEMKLHALGAVGHTFLGHGNGVYHAPDEQVVRAATYKDLGARHVQLLARSLECRDSDCWCCAYKYR